jgi:hypothetical protein
MRGYLLAQIWSGSERFGSAIAHREVCTFSGWGCLPDLTWQPYPTHYRSAFACSRFRYPLGDWTLSCQGLVRAGRSHVFHEHGHPMGFTEFHHSELRGGSGTRLRSRPHPFTFATTGAPSFGDLAEIWGPWPVAFLGRGLLIGITNAIGQSLFTPLTHYVAFIRWFALAFPSPLPLAATRSPVTGWMHWCAPATFLMASYPRITPGACTRWGRAQRMARSD